MIKTPEQIFDEFLAGPECYCEWPAEDYLYEELKATMRGEVLYCDIHQDINKIQDAVDKAARTADTPDEAPF